jgi:hypothetical protein
VTAPSGRPSPPRPHPPGETSDGRATCPISFLSSLDELRCPHPWSGSGIRLLSWFRVFASSSWTAGKLSLPGTRCGACHPPALRSPPTAGSSRCFTRQSCSGRGCRAAFRCGFDASRHVRSFDRRLTDRRNRLTNGR